MNYQELFVEVKKEFPEHIAVGVCVATGIHLSTKIKGKDFDEPGRYENRVEKKIREVLWDNDDVDIIIKIHKCVYTWDIQRVLGEKKSFTQIMDELK